MASTVSHLHQLTHLDLSFSRINNSDWTHEIHSLQHCHQLTSLNLDGCDIGRRGAHALCSQSFNWPELSILNVRHNQLKSEGARAIAEMMTRCTKMTELWIERWSFLCFDCFTLFVFVLI